MSHFVTLFYRAGIFVHYTVVKDGYNTVTFKPVTTAALRLEVMLQPAWSAGIQEWQVK